MGDKNLREYKRPILAAPFSKCCDAPLEERVDLLDMTLYAACSKCGEQVDYVGTALAD
jgi:hypothetical protein